MFAEICLLANSRRIASARAASVCDLFVLPASSFKSILEEFPDVKVLVEHVAIHKLLDLRKHVSITPFPLAVPSYCRLAHLSSIFDCHENQNPGLLSIIFVLMRFRAQKAVGVLNYDECVLRLAYGCLPHAIPNKTFIALVYL